MRDGRFWSFVVLPGVQLLILLLIVPVFVISLALDLAYRLYLIFLALNERGLRYHERLIWRAY